MREKGLHRREALKVFGSIGASVLGSRLLSRYPVFQMDQADPGAPNIIIMLFDALSARHMSLHGYQRPTTPHIDHFAKSSTVYHRHYSASNFTQSSTASMLTGVHPWSHRSLEFFETLRDTYEKENIFSRISPSYRTIAYTHNIHAASILEQFKSDINLWKPTEDLVLFEENPLEHVFKNDRLIGEFAAKRWLENFFPPSYSLFFSSIFAARSSSVYKKLNHDHQDQFPMGMSERDGYMFKMEDAIDWIADTVTTESGPIFGYFHLLPPHEDYKPRVEFYDMFAGDQYRLPKKPEHFFSDEVLDSEQQTNCQRYDEYIAYVDEEFRRLVETLEKHGVLDHTYLILTSDHGQLFERGMHGHLQPTLYESVIHIPLIIRVPGQTQGINIHSLTSSLDLVPTLLHLAGQPSYEGLEGSLLPSFGGEQDSDRIVFSTHARRNPKNAPLTRVTFAAIQWPFKLIQYRGYEGLDDFDELFNLETDPEELNNIADQNPSIVKFLAEELRRNQTSAETNSLKH